MAADQKGARAESAWIVFFDESGISLIPPVRRTWSPRGHTPILRHRVAWKRASMAAALGYHPRGTKTANCQLGVSVDAVTEQASCPLDWRLFVPERWDDAAMAARRAACHLPEGVHHRPKWQLVLDMLDELAGWELHPPVLLADCGYGDVGEFRGGLDARQIGYVVEVRSDTSAYPKAGTPDHPCLHRQGPPAPPPATTTSAAP